MKRHLYPKNWEEIALRIKTAANWRCKKCDRPCLKPNENWMDFVSDLHRTQSDWYWDTYEENGRIIEKKGRFVLTTAHLDQNPANNDDANLMALCPTCHNRHDGKARAKNAKKTRYENKHRGQFKLWNS